MEMPGDVAMRALTITILPRRRDPCFNSKNTRGLLASIDMVRGVVVGLMSKEPSLKADSRLMGRSM
jgi:hypothetical protein